MTDDSPSPESAWFTDGRHAATAPMPAVAPAEDEQSPAVLVGRLAAELSAQRERDAAWFQLLRLVAMSATGTPCVTDVSCETSRARAVTDKPLTCDDAGQSPHGLSAPPPTHKTQPAAISGR